MSRQRVSGMAAAAAAAAATGTRTPMRTERLRTLPIPRTPVGDPAHGSAWSGGAGELGSWNRGERTSGRQRAPAPESWMHALGSLEPRARPHGATVTPPMRTPEPSWRPTEPSYDSDFHVNMGHAIAAIRRDTPYLLERDPDFSVYAANVVFRESIWGHGVLHGLDTYRRALRWIRVVMRWSFRRPAIEVANMVGRGDDAVQVWWTFHATPRNLSTVLGGQPARAVTFEGISVYQFDRRGRICSHDVTNILPPPEALAHVQMLQSIFGPARVPAPTC